ncbi:plastocyanin/azurin family copper-binding protein [Qipengyuania sp. ASV99]|uniref:plastocyanin/azurin family copper-binding protein n=1 Tax=Qipengyuania sp. ASV99 TaxID=3399681 RepID=UPI003A4C57C7
MLRRPWSMALMLLTLSACDRPAPSPEQASSDALATARSDTASRPGGAETTPTGKVIEIRMYTVDPDDLSRQHVFKPRLVRAEIGDTIRFVPTEVSHQSSSIGAMLPDGVSGWEGAINAEVSYVLPAAGLYGFQCVPHYAAGMVGLIVVEGEGKTDNLDAARAASHPGLGAPQFSAIFAEADERRMFD